MLYLVGLGPGDPSALPARNLDLLTSGIPVLLRTARHPVVEAGPVADALSALPTGTVTALDEEYERGASFEATYTAIVERVLDACRTQADVVYAVPGHPLVGESTPARILEQAKAEGIAVKVVGATSFVDACLEAVGVGITGDLHVLDALSLSSEDSFVPDVLSINGPLLLYQVHSRLVASETKLALMRSGYPDEFPVTVIRAAGLPEAEVVYETPLYTLDRTNEHDHLTSVYVPALSPDLRRPTFNELARIMTMLRNPDGGCPWDLKQTHQTLRRYVLEEAYEVAEAIDSGDPDKLCEELGDLLLQVVFHAQLGHETGDFDAVEVCRTINEKMIRRHPHIFGTVQADDAETVLVNWNAIKAIEKAERGEAAHTSILDGVPKSYPALLMALEISKRAVKVGFEWPDTDGVLAKVEEEVSELKAEVLAPEPDKERITGELGDLLFTIVNVARKMGVDPEDALRAQIDRFRRRFNHIEVRAGEQSRPLESLTLDEMESYWREAKAQEKVA